MDEHLLHVYPETLTFDKKRDSECTLTIKNQSERNFVARFFSSTPCISIETESFTCSKNQVIPLKIKYISTERGDDPLSLIYLRFYDSGIKLSRKITVQFGDQKNPPPSSNLKEGKLSASTSGLCNQSAKLNSPQSHVPPKQKHDSPDCKICAEAYDETDHIPRVLIGCGHTVCEDCAVKLKGEKTEIECPFDRTVTSNVSDVQNLPKNFAIVELLSTSPSSKPSTKPQKGPEEKFEVQCAENPYHEASVYCDWCKADLCEGCFKVVHAANVLAHHKKIALSEKPIQLPKCLKHPNHLSEYVCQDSKCSIAKKLMCQKCHHEDHKGHMYEDLLKKLMSNEKKAIEMVKRITSQVEVLRKNAGTEREILTSYGKSSEQYQQKSKEISAYFEEKKLTALQRFDELVDKKIKKMVDEEGELRKQLKEAAEVKQRMEKIVKSKNELLLVDDFCKKALELCDRKDDKDPNVDLGSLKITWKDGVQLFM